MPAVAVSRTCRGRWELPRAGSVSAKRAEYGRRLVDGRPAGESASCRRADHGSADRVMHRPRQRRRRRQRVADFGPLLGVETAAACKVLPADREGPAAAPASAHDQQVSGSCTHVDHERGPRGARLPPLLLPAAGCCFNIQALCAWRSAHPPPAVAAVAVSAVQVSITVGTMVGTASKSDRLEQRYNFS